VSLILTTSFDCLLLVLRTGYIGIFYCRGYLSQRNSCF